MGRRLNSVSQVTNFTLSGIDKDQIIEAGIFLGKKGFK